MRISRIEALAADGAHVALWGWGREGRAAYHALRQHSARLPLTLLCTAAEAVEAQALGDARLAIETCADAEALSRFALVVKSPGISPYCDAAQQAAARGTRFIGGTSIWFAEHAGADGVLADAVCITGTKGKSTSTSLLAHLLRAAGHRTALAGNIGLPLLEVLNPQPAPRYWAIELSSYQTGDVAESGVRPQVAMVLNLFPEHLDWHGSHERYVADKLRLVTDAKPRIAVLNAADPILSKLQLPHSEVRWFNTPDGWHLRDDALYRGDTFVLDTRPLPLPGRHNRGNLCAVLTAIEALGLDAAPLAAHAASFRPLPHRLQSLGTREGIEYVNDSISTTPHASLAALECFGDAAVALLLGGHDRGLDWSGFAEAMRTRAPSALVTLGQNGPRIRAELDAAGVASDAAQTLDEAVGIARRRLALQPQARKVVLLSPGAPSFGAYRDYVERGRHFAALAGFDPQAISAIPGLGVE